MTVQLFRLAFTLFLCSLFSNPAGAQMRKIFNDPASWQEVRGFSFFSPSEGYIAYPEAVAYTTDTGRTQHRIYITAANLDPGSYFSFGWPLDILGVKAFHKDTLVVYGSLSLFPAILYSVNGGNSFRLVYYQSSLGPFPGGIKDMVFPQNDNIGYAVDKHRVYKTVNRGISWQTIFTDLDRDFDQLQAFDNNRLYASSSHYNNGILYKTTTGGGNWQVVTLPGRHLGNSFISFEKGWVNTEMGSNYGGFYHTSDGGASWTRMNDPAVDHLPFKKFTFVNDSVGYTAGNNYITLKTSDSGKVWEVLPRDNTFSHMFFGHTRWQAWNQDQFIVGGAHGLIELTTNGGGNAFPKALFRFDTSGLSQSNTVKLVNHSRGNAAFQWIKNGVPLATTYHAQYTHTPGRIWDTVQLVVERHGLKDTFELRQSFSLPVVVSGFTPTTAATGGTVTITGQQFVNVTSVRFGNVPAASFTVLSPTSIRAVVGTGASGAVTVITQTGIGSLAGFEFIPPPQLYSVSPTEATAGSTVVLQGAFLTGATAATIGGQPVSFQVWSPTSMTVTPGASGQGNISVTTPGGSATIGGFVLLPKITSFAPVTGSTGTLLTVTGTGFSNATAVRVGGTPVLSFTATATSIQAIVGNGATGDVVVTTPSGSSTLPGFTWKETPVITSVAPQQGIPGSTVQITGNHFDPLAANNTVYFGGVQATVMAATATSLTVTVPVGASFAPPSVTSNGLTAYAAQPFMPVQGGSNALSAASFTGSSTLNVFHSAEVKTGDIDRDGIRDILVGNDTEIHVFRGTSATALTYAAPLVLNPGTSGDILLEDIDSDGLLDLVVKTVSNNTVAVVRNESQAGTIAFGAPLSITMGAGKIQAADMDGDGRADLLAGGILLQNRSESGQVRFSAPVTMVAGPTHVVLADLNGDDRPELIVPNNPYETGTQIRIYPNQSIAGTVQVGTPVSINFTGTLHLLTGDMDGDGRQDLAALSSRTPQAFVFRNTTVGSTISFDVPKAFPLPSFPDEMALADSDGDGKPDLAVSTNEHRLTVLKNLSQPGQLHFADYLAYHLLPYGDRTQITLADMNGDMKPEALVSTRLHGTVHIFLNGVKPDPYIHSFTPLNGEAGTTVTITGGNFTGATSVHFGGTPATSFTVVSDGVIQAVVGNGNAGSIRIVTPTGAAEKEGFIFGIPPVITSVLPPSGIPGSLVTIEGQHFSPQPSENIVYFGGMKAPVMSSTSTSITAQVPFGALCQPVSVTTRNLSAASNLPFLTSSLGTVTGFNSNSFAYRQEFINKGGTWGGIEFADFDGDGQPDILGTQGQVRISRNTTNGNQITFAPVMDLPLVSSFAYYAIANDFDGDGKQDIAVSHPTPSSVSFYRNTGTPGNLQFAAPVNYPTGDNTSILHPDLTSADLDMDGRIDVALINQHNGSLSILRNTSAPGLISFAKRMDMAIPGSINRVIARDLDGDKLPELILHATSSPIYIFRNISSLGGIAFEPMITLTHTGFNIWYGTDVVDIDGDGRNDIIVGNTQGAVVLRNTSSPSAISFASSVNLIHFPSRGVAMGDLTGDGRPDIFLLGDGEIRNAVSRNISTPGNIAFEPFFDIPHNTVSPFWGGRIADLDGDGRNDLIGVNLSAKFAVYRNLIGAPDPAQVCALDTIQLTSNITGTQYQWQQDAGTGYVNLSDNSQYAGSQTATLTINTVPANYNNYKFRCLVDGSTLSHVLYLTVFAKPQALGGADKVKCGSSSVSIGTTTPMQPGHTYTWTTAAGNLAGLTPVINVSPTATTTYIYTVSNGQCTARDTVVVTVMTAVTPSVTISASQTTVCDGSPVTFTALPVNGGSSPNFQWFVNNVAAGTNSPIFTPATLPNNAQVRVTMTTNAPCATQATASSNTIVISSGATQQPLVTIQTAATTVCAGTAVTFTATPTHGGTAPVYQWMKNGLPVGTNAVQYTTNALANGDQVSVTMTSNSPCATPLTANSNVITMTLLPSQPASVTIAPSTAIACTGETVSFVATPASGMTSLSYQWKVNIANAGTNSPNFQSSTLANGAVVQVELTGIPACGSTPVMVRSNAVTMEVKPLVMPTITITGMTTIVQGTETTITAAVTNGGTAPQYFWGDSTGTVGWQLIPGASGASISYRPLVNGAKLACVLVSNVACAVEDTVVSNVLTFTLQPTAVSVVNEASRALRLYPNPASDLLRIDSLRVEDRWEQWEIITADGRIIRSGNAMNQAMLRIPVYFLKPGSYMLALRSKRAGSAYLKFIKQ